MSVSRWVGGFMGRVVVVLNWILNTGTWDDSGVWDDTKNWID